MAFLDETGLAEVWSIITDEYGRYKLHWWKTTATSTTSAHYTMGGLTSTGNITAIGTWYFKGSSIVVDANGNLSIPNETSVVPTNTATSVAGSYIRCEASDGNKFYYCDTGSTIKKYGTNTLTLTNYKVVTGHPAVTNVGDVAYLWNENYNAHPHSGTVNGLEYEYLGIPFDNSVNAVKIATGSYTGTGAYKEASANSLAFDFDPKIVFVCNRSEGYSGANGIIWASDLTTSYTVRGYAYNDLAAENDYYAKKDGNTVSWYYKSGAAQQMNTSGAKYAYIAIG